jgi:hypothetical protein
MHLQLQLRNALNKKVCMTYKLVVTFSGFTENCFGLLKKAQISRPYKSAILCLGSATRHIPS